MKEILLSASLLFGGGATEALATHYDPTEPHAAVKQPITEVKEEPNLAPFLDAIRANVKYDGDPRFFRQMENRAQNNPNKYFEVRPMPNGTFTLYYPQGLNAIATVGYVHTQDNIMLDDIDGPLNAFAMTEAVILDIDQNGSLEYEERPDLLNWNQIKNGLNRYLVEPEQTRSLEWNYAGSSQFGPATLYKSTEDNPMDIYTFSGNEFGFLRIDHTFVEIPIVGTDIVPTSPTP